MKGGKCPQASYLHPIPKKTVPFETLHMDHLDPFVKSRKGNAHLLVLVDGFSKFVFCDKNH